MKIIKVFSKKQLISFIRFPWKLYSKSCYWVPPLIFDTIQMFSKKNKFWEHADRQLFLAYDEYNNIIGRIAGIIDYRYILFQNNKCGFFGFFECVENVHVAKELFNSVKEWLHERYIYKMIGPVNPSINSECGFLSEGFNSYPSFMMPYTHEYYLSLVEKCDLKKIKELYAYDINLTNCYKLIDKLDKISFFVKKKNPNLKIRNINKHSFEKDLNDIMYIYNCAWVKNWGFVPWDNMELLSISSKLKMIVDTNMIIICYISEKPVGMLIFVPDYNKIIKKLNGKLLPFGIFKFLYYKNKINNLRLIIMGVINEYRFKGIEAVMYKEGLKNAIEFGYKHCEFSWILDDNIMTNRSANNMGGKISKKYVLYGN
jgi:hypothetical protein